MTKNKRIMLKLSGEALAGDHVVHDHGVIQKFCQDIKLAYNAGYQICVVVGGGNICRGSFAERIGIDRSTADYMGMLATVINAMAVQSMLESLGVSTRVQSAISMTSICEPYIRRRAIRHMEKNRVVIFSAGTGNPFFTTDTAATLRAIEMGCDVILKGTQVDGIYSADPRTNPNAERYKTLDYKSVIAQELNIMDTAAITLARENNIPIIVFNIHRPNALMDVLNGSGDYTLVTNHKT